MAADTEFSDEDHVSPRELAVRLADLDCDVTVGLTRDRSLDQAEKLHTWLDRNAETVLQLRNLLVDAEAEIVRRTDDLARRGVRALQESSAGTQRL